MAKPQHIIIGRDLADEARDVLAGRAEIARRAAAAGLPVGEYLRARQIRRRARARAEAAGLHYWPAIAYGPVIDPRAFAAAEEVLAAATGEVWSCRAGTRGGWDGEGHYGVSARVVAACWYAAGCRDGGKFRLAVRLHWEARRVNAPPPEIRKGDSLPWLRAYARGYRWLLRAGRSSRSGRTRYPLLGGWRLSRKAIAALGRLSAPLRYWAVARYLDGEYPERIRIRDLDWAMVRRVQRALASGDAHAAAACLPVPAALDRLGLAPSASRMREPSRLRDALCAGREWARFLPLLLVRQLAIGVPPMEIAGAQFSRAEAMGWLRSGAPDRADWLAAARGLPPHRSLHVVAWMTRLKSERRLGALSTRHNLGAIGMIARMGDPDDLHDDRDAGSQLRLPPAMPDGQPWPRIALAEILDEVQDADIVTGADSVLAVLARVLERRRSGIVEMQLQDHRPLMPVPHWARQLSRGMRLLNTAAALAAEGIAMQHCVGSYADTVRRGQCVILSIVSMCGMRRSTLELSADGRTVRQHLGRRNAPAPARHVALIRAWLRRRTVERRDAA